eukprot:5802915-Pyramimonas_sp.AAC.1
MERRELHHPELHGWGGALDCAHHSAGGVCQVGGRLQGRHCHPPADVCVAHQQPAGAAAQQPHRGQVHQLI